MRSLWVWSMAARSASPGRAPNTAYSSIAGSGDEGVRDGLGRRKTPGRAGLRHEADAPNGASQLRCATAVFALVFSALLVSAGADAQPVRQEPPLVAAERLGAPFAARWPQEYYPRNVWDMQVFGGFVYFGAGNSSNFGPSPNAGPVPIIRYDGQRFENVFSLQEEQVDMFRVFGGVLYTPGHDSRRRGEVGAVYRFDGRAWRSSPDIAGAVHVYDYFRRAGVDVAVGGARGDAPAAWISTSLDGAWRPLTYRANPVLSEQMGYDGAPRGGRLFSLFEIGHALYASGSIQLASPNPEREFAFATLFQIEDVGTLTPMSVTIARLGDQGFAAAALHGADLFPGADGIADADFALLQVRRAVSLDGASIYIGALNHNDHQWRPVGVFAAPNLNDARALAVPEGVLVYDLLVHDRSVYALGNRELAPNRFEVQVLKLHEMSAFHPVARFEAPAFARSFELYRGDWYVALGAEVSQDEAALPRAEAAQLDWRDRLSAQAGLVLRIRGENTFRRRR